jgi:alpha-L-fucosidase
MENGQMTFMAWQALWESLDRRPVPGWFDEAKFGIFIHWGLYSVPAWAPRRRDAAYAGAAYAEWYGWNMNEKAGQTAAFHTQTYGAQCRYADFAPHFRAELFDPARWAELFAASGARYVVLTAKHHDGFCLWPSTHSWNWNSQDIGPHRDLFGELAAAVRAQGLRMGAYYSLLEWYRPLYQAAPEQYALEHMIPQLRELVGQYHPSLLFTDGEWDHDSAVYHSPEFLAWLFNESAVKDEIVVNDRWGKDTRSRHGGYFTTEYGKVDEHGTELAAHRKWEECRSIGYSFGFNRNEDAADYLAADQLLRLLVTTVSRGGNLLLNIGPAADGSIPVVMQERLLTLGRWLGENGAAIYGTRPWRVESEGDDLFYTVADERVFAICFDCGVGEWRLVQPRPGPHAVICRLDGAPVEWAPTGDELHLRSAAPLGLARGPVVFELTGFA